MSFKQGEYVKIIEREQTPADVKNGTYYPFFCGLAGTVDRIYDNEICISVDLDTLPKDVLKRHTEIQDAIKKKWLNGLSGEARNRLTPEEKRFELAYTILVQTIDLEKSKPGTPKPAAIKSAAPVDQPEESAPAPKAAKAEEAPIFEESSAADELSAAERAFLREREEQAKKS